MLSFTLMGERFKSLCLRKTQSQAYEVPKIAVLGTCFSRNGLNTLPYFNPDYKNI